jgi:hypothetical protein
MSQFAWAGPTYIACKGTQEASWIHPSRKASYVLLKRAEKYDLKVYATDTTVDYLGLTCIFNESDSLVFHCFLPPSKDDIINSARGVTTGYDFEGELTQSSSLAARLYEKFPNGLSVYWISSFDFGKFRDCTVVE